MKRGEIYYIDIPFYTGSEITKNRPGIIVSCDALNNVGSLATVVYLSASPKRMSPSHVEVYSSYRPSTAMCEQIYTIDKSRIGNYVGELSQDEMEQVDAAIRRTLGLPDQQSEECSACTTAETDSAEERAGAAANELEVYKRLYTDLIDRLTKVA